MLATIPMKTMKNLSRLVVCVLALFLSMNANALLTVGQYKKMKSQRDVVAYITGLGQGVFWSNAFLASYRPEFVCFTRNKEFDQAIILSALEEEISTGKFKDNEYVEPIIAPALVKRYPCK